jgi:Protein of unknown function
MLHEEVPVPLDPLTAEEEARIAQLSEADKNSIDGLLLSNTTIQWRKVAMVVAMTMHANDLVSDIPVTFYALRIKDLVARGRLESQGNVEFIRFSEVRLPASFSGTDAT